MFPACLMLSRSWAGAVALILAALLFSACTPVREQPTDEAMNSPLSPYWSAIGDYSLGDAIVIDEAAAAEADTPAYGDLVAECMKEQGFDYWPEPVEDAPGEFDDEEFTVERAAQQGYGIVPPYREFEYQPVTEETAITDPNQYYTSKMSASMFAAYSEALFGADWDGIDPEDAEYDWREGGCDAAARHEIESAGVVSEETGEDGGASIEATPYDDLIELMNIIPEEVESSASWRRVLGEWSDCMAERGHVFDTWEHAGDSIFEEYDELMAATQPGATSLEDTVFLEDGQDWLPDKAKYEALYEQERTIAVADIECRQEVDIEAATDRIIGELEQEFVDRHRDRLDEMKRWFEAHPSIGQ
ncbi:hypothetical protein EVS81_00900 [Leucobacter triazinivorans]|uniref:Uncharacterized protein n=2 Tax=Leucobacter triazinivorans TaxID=1784719 RepID=A0A4P6KBA2_9MICO|nr:hypothetical protein EVS81_00900 [Leucobacter triazinivorans]